MFWVYLLDIVLDLLILVMISLTTYEVYKVRKLVSNIRIQLMKEKIYTENCKVKRKMI